MIKIKLRLHKLFIFLFLRFHFYEILVHYIFHFSNKNFFRENRKTWLVLARAGHTEDVLMVKNHLNELSYLFTQSFFIKFVSSFFLESDSNFTFKNTYLNNKNKYNQSVLAWEKILNVFKKKYNVHIISSGFFGYRYFFSVAEACKNIDVNFVLINKEAVISTEQSSYWSKFAKENYLKLNSKINFLYNDISKKMYVDTNFMEKDKTFVIGCPKIDLLWKKREQLSNKENKIGLFNFDFNNGVQYELASKNFQNNLPILPIKEMFKKNKTWNKLWHDVHEEFINIAATFPKIEFYIKLKNSKKAIVALDKFLETIKKPPNLRIITNKNSFDLIQHSIAIVGFNSTCLLEAAILKTIAITPIWHEAEKLKNKLIEFDNISYIANSRSDLKNLIHRAIDKKIKYNVSERNLISETDKWLGNSKGDSAFKISKIIKEVIL
jgi:hypothetical protein